MATHLNLPTKVEGSTLTASEFNAVVIAINENADTLQEAYDAIEDKLGATTIVVDSNTSVVIDSVESLIEYLAEYGAATPTNNTAPLIKIKNTTYVYRLGQTLDFDIELFDAEGGQLTLTGKNPDVAQGTNSFIVPNLYVGTNTLNLTALIYGAAYYDPESDVYQAMLPEGSYVFSEIVVTDKLGKSSTSPLTLNIIVGAITLTSNFLSEQTYRQNIPINVQIGIASVTNTVDLTYTLTGRMLVEDENVPGNYIYQDYASVIRREEGKKLTPNDANFISGQLYYIDYVTETGFTELGDYTLSVVATGLGVTSNTLNINMVINKAGILYSSTNFNTSDLYYVGDTVVLPVNIFYDENPEYVGLYTYRVKAWLEVNGMQVSPDYLSAETAEQKNIQVVLLLPDSGSNCSIKYTSEILEFPVEVEEYWANTNELNLSLQQKSSYIVLETPASKIELYLSAKGKSNNSPNWQIWENKYTLNLPQYFGTLTGFNTELNGWEVIGDNQHYGDALELNGTAYAEINYKPFDSFETNTTGLTVEFSIREESLVGEGIYQLSIGRPEVVPSVGIYVTDNKLLINGLASNITVPIICDTRVLTKNGEWVEGDEYAHVAVTFNVTTKEVYVYINGVISSFGTFADQELFTSQNDATIFINGFKSLLGGVDGIAETKIRFIRVYKKCLTTEEILGNYVASYPEDTGRALLEELNSIATPILSSAYMEGDRSAIQKDVMTQLEFSFVPGNEENIAETYIPEPIAIGEYDAEYQTMTAPFPIDVDLQGNSSLSYPVKNYGIDIFDGQAWDTLGSKESKDYNMVYNMGTPSVRLWPDWDSYHLKGNYIDSSHSNNLIMAKLSEQVFRFPFNWETSEGQELYTPIFGTATPFKNYTVTRPDEVVDTLSRYPAYPLRLAVDGFPFLMKGDYKIDQTWYSKQFIGLYTWNLKQHRKLYNMPSVKADPNRRHYIYRCESNGDSVHEELRSGYCKFLDMKKQQLLLDYYGRVITPSYIESAQNAGMFDSKVAADYTWGQINATGSLTQPNGKYTWVKYALSETSETLDNSPVGNLYIGIAIDKVLSTKSENYEDYSWTEINITEGVLNNYGTYTLIRYAEDATGLNMGNSAYNKSHIGFVYNVEKYLWVQGVDYWDKTGDATEMAWRQGAELIMDWEARDPDDFGLGHWEQYLNGSWTRTADLINPNELDANSVAPNKVLRFVWDKLENTGDADRSGNQPIDYYTSILATESDRTENYSPTLPSLSNPEQTFYRIQRNKAILATQQHTDFLNAIQWMASASDECFADAAIFEKFFDLRNCLDYVLCCLTFCLTDSVGRNLTMIGWDQNSQKTSTDGVMNRERVKFYPVFYDIDTAFGTNVQGGLYATPYIEWPYDIGGGDPADPEKNLYTAGPESGWEYNCFGTNFLKRISKNYGPALAKRYEELRSGTYDPLKPARNSDSWISAPFDYSSILQLYSKQMVARIGERYFNQDAVYKYIGFEGDPDINDKRNYISNARGNKLMFMKNFLKKRLEYIDGIMGYVPDAADMAYIEHFHGGTITLGIKTAVDCKIRVSFAQNQVVSISCKKDVVTNVSYNYQTVTQHILRIYNSGKITEIQGLTNISMKTGKFSSCPNLKVLDLSGTTNFVDQNSYLNIGGCERLEVLNLTGCGTGRQTAFNVAIDGCPRLKELYASNSAIQVSSFTANPKLQIINVNNCNFQQSINVSGLTLLTTLIFNKNTVTSLNISQSSISGNSLGFGDPNVYTALQTLVIVGNTGLTSLTFDPTSFTSLQSLTISDCLNLVTVENLFKNRQNAVVINTNFLENCTGLTKVNNLFEGSNISEIGVDFLKGCTAIQELKGLFKNCTNLQSIPSGALVAFPNLVDISEIFAGASLQTYSDIYTGEVITGKQVHNVFKSSGGNVFSNCPSLTTITDAFNGAELINVPANLFLVSPLVNVSGAFANITNPGSEFANEVQGLTFTGNAFVSNPAVTSITGFFANSVIDSVQSNIFSSCPELVNASYLFSGSTLTSIPATIFANTPKLQNLSNTFACAGISSIPNGALSEFAALTNISNIFLNSSITTLPAGFLKIAKITAFKFSDLGLSNLLAINADLLSSDTIGQSVNNTLWNITNLFSNTAVTVIPENFFSTNPSISTVTNMLLNSNITTVGNNFLLTNSATSFNSAFSGITRSFTIGNDVMKNSGELLTAVDMFKDNTGLTAIGDNFLQNCAKLTTVSALFMGATGLTSVGSNLLSNCPLLVTITDIFNGTAFVTTPVNFAYASVLINSLAGVFSNNAIVNISNDFLRGNTGLTTISGVFTNSAVQNIGNYFMYQSTGVTSIASLFENNVVIDTIGTHFFGDSALTNANSAFANSTLTECASFDDIPTLATANSMFKNSELTSNIENYFIGSLTMTDVTECFYNCYGITSASPHNGTTQLWERVTAITNYSNCFRYCSNMSDYLTVPIAWGGLCATTLTFLSSRGYTLTSPTLDCSLSYVKLSDFQYVIYSEVGENVTFTYTATNHVPYTDSFVATTNRNINFTIVALALRTFTITFDTGGYPSNVWVQLDGQNKQYGTNGVVSIRSNSRLIGSVGGDGCNSEVFDYAATLNDANYAIGLEVRIEITSVADLIILRNGVNSNASFDYKGITIPAYALNMVFTLTADLDLSSVCGSGIGNWVPIGRYVGTITPFKGTFDGNGYTISNLYINDSTITGKYVGLFGYVFTGEIKNLTLTNINIIGNQYTGGLLGYADGTVNISNCNTYGSISSSNQNYCGGIVAYHAGTGTIQYCTNYCSVLTGYAGYGSGILGYGQRTVKYCINQGTIVGSNVSGISYQGTISYCINNGIIGDGTSRSNLVGISYQGTCKYCINAGIILNNYSSDFYVSAITIAGTANYCLNIATTLTGGGTASALMAKKTGSTYNYYDSQMYLLGYGDTDTAGIIEGKITENLLGTSLRMGSSGIGWTDEHWVFTSNLYPIPRGLETIDNAIATATPLLINSTLKYNNFFPSIHQVFVPIISGNTYSISNSVFSVNNTTGEITSTNSSFGESLLNIERNGVIYKKIRILYLMEVSISTANDLITLASGINSLATFTLNGVTIPVGGLGITFSQTTDIDLSTVCGPGIGNWPIIGNDNGKKFYGNYKGNGYLISNLYTNNTTTFGSGFVSTLGAKLVDFGESFIEKVRLISVNMTVKLGWTITKYYEGANSRLSNCTVTGTIIASGDFYGMGYPSGSAGIVRKNIINIILKTSNNSATTASSYFAPIAYSNPTYNIFAGAVSASGASTLSVMGYSESAKYNLNVGLCIGTKSPAASSAVTGFSATPPTSGTLNYYNNSLMSFKGCGEWDYVGKSEGKNTAQLTGISLRTGINGVGWTDENWVFNTDRYPIPLTMEIYPEAIAASYPITLPSGEFPEDISSNFYVPVIPGFSWISPTNIATVDNNTGLVTINQNSHGYCSLELYYGTILTRSVGFIKYENVPINNRTDMLSFRAGLISGSPFTLNGILCPVAGTYMKFNLTNNINMTDGGVGTWNSQNLLFSGILNGNNYTISNLSNSSATQKGLFGVTQYAEIWNLTLKDCSFYNTGLTYESYNSVFKNIFLDNVTILIGTDQFYAGICGNSHSSAAINCRTSGTFNMTGGGGIFGWADGNSYFKSCENNANIIAQYGRTGGMVGLYSGSLVNYDTIYTPFKYNVNNGDISLSNPADTLEIGGIAGSISNAWVLYCVNNGNIVVSGTSKTGGIFGSGGTAIYCVNNGIVKNNSTGARVGGIVGTSEYRPVYYSISTNNVIVLNTITSGALVGYSGGQWLGSFTGLYYDKQFNTLLAMTNADNAYAYGKLTSQLIGTSLRTGATGAGYTDENWVFNAGRYPIPKGLETNASVIAGSEPVNLLSTETFASVATDFTVGTTSGTTWNDTNNLVTIVDDDVTRVANGAEILIASKDGVAYKTVELTISGI